MLTEIFLVLFAVTFFVAFISFSAYGYLLFTLLKHRSDSFKTESIGDFIAFLWKLLLYYINRAVSGFFDIQIIKDKDFLKVYHGEITDEESTRDRMVSAYKLFSATYILFFILLICLFLVFLYLVSGPVD